MVDRDTKAGLIENAASALGIIGKELLVNRAERRQQEAAAQHQKELAEIRARAESEGPLPASGPETNESGRGNQQVVDSLSEASTLVGRIDDALSQAEGAEECDLCKQLIRAVRQKPAREQRQLLPELRDFLADVDDGTPQAELVERLEDSPALLELIEEQFDMGGSPSGGSSGIESTGESPTRRRGRERSPSRERSEAGLSNWN